MKKTLALMLCALLALGLCACGTTAAEPDPTAEPETAATPEPSAQPEVTEPPANAPEEAPVEEETDSVDKIVALVLSMEGEPLEELIAIIGEPNSVEYTPSCIVDGEDGQLYYDGFTVYTEAPRDGVEYIHDCERN